jgi:hypothetical protein
MLPPLFTEALDVVVGADGELELLLHAAMPVRQAMARSAMPPLLLENLIVARRPSPRPGLSQGMWRSLVP